MNSMTIRDVAVILLERQNARYSFVLDGASRARLGSDGFEYARFRGWLELDEVTSCMRVSMRAQKINEIREAAAVALENSPPIRAQNGLLTAPGRDQTISHAEEYVRSISVDVVVERLEQQLKNVDPTVIGGPEASWREFIMMPGEVCALRAVEDANANPIAAAQDQVALQKFHKPFSQCSPQEQAAVAAELQQRTRTQPTAQPGTPPATPATVPAGGPPAPGVAR